MTIAVATKRVPAVRWKAKWGDSWIRLSRGSFAIDRVEEGCCTKIGKASLVLYDVRPVNREEGAPAVPNIPNDAFVQIGAEDLDVPVDQTADSARGLENRLDWLWIGRVGSRALVDEGSERQGSEVSSIRVVTLHLEGLASLLHQVVCQRGQVMVNGTPTEILRCLPGNDRRDGLNIGNRSASAPYVHDLSRGTTVGHWTARQYLTRLLEDHLNATRFPAWPTFTLAGQVAALDYVDEFRAEGRPLDEVLNDYAGFGRGLTWALEPATDGTGPVAIRITSGSKSAFSIPLPDGGNVTIPASDRQVPVLDTSDSHFQVAADLVERPRRWTVQGQVATTLTVRFALTGGVPSDGLTRGWASADDAQAGSTNPKYALVGRFFRLPPAWGGLGYLSDDGCASALGRDGNGYDGNRTVGGTFPGDAAVLDGDLLIPEIASATGAAVSPEALKAWATGTGTLPQDAPCDTIRLYVGGTAPTATWEEITSQFTVRVVRRYPAPGLLIGTKPADGATLLSLITGKQLLVTLTIQEPLPLIISREPAGATSDVWVRTDQVLHQVASGTVVGLDGTKLVKTTARKIVRDDRPRLKALLTQLGPFLDRSGTARLHGGLKLRPADYVVRPGTLVVDLDGGQGPGQYIRLLSVVTGRTWTFSSPGYGTTYDLEPLSLDPRSYL